MNDLLSKERSLQSGGNATETSTAEGNATAPTEPISSEPIPSPTAPKAPTAVSSPTGSSVPAPSSVTPVSPTGFSSPTSAEAPSASGGGVFPANGPGSGALAPTYSYNDKTSPAWSSGANTSSSSSPSVGSGGFFTPLNILLVAVAVGAVALLVFWKFCKAWKLRREKQRLRLQSTRVDMVLGDMQMVGMDDYDGDDPELI